MKTDSNDPRAAAKAPGSREAEARCRADLAGLRRALARVQQLLELPESTLFAPHPEISLWCIAEQLNHLILADDLSVRNVRTVAKGSGMLLRHPEKRDPEALAILTRGRFPRGQAEAPRFVRPPKVVDVPLCRRFLDEIEAELVVIEAALPALLAETRCVPHQVLGDLTGPEWLRFARAHSVHHLLIVRDLLAAS